MIIFYTFFLLSHSHGKTVARIMTLGGNVVCTFSYDDVNDAPLRARQEGCLLFEGTQNQDDEGIFFYGRLLTLDEKENKVNKAEAEENDRLHRLKRVIRNRKIGLKIPKTIYEDDSEKERKRYF